MSAWILLIVFCIILCFILYVVGVFVYDEWKMRKEAPYVGSYSTHKKLLRQNTDKIHGKNIVDMGCGDGGMLRFFIKKMGYTSGDGYDIRHMPIWIGRAIRYFYSQKNIGLYHQDFYNATLQKYDTIYIFLWPDTVLKLEKRIHDSIRPDTVVITNTFHFSDRSPYDVIRNEKGKAIFQLYRK